VPVTKWRGFLHERHAIDAQIHLSKLDSVLERLLAVVPCDAGTRATDVRLHENRISQVRFANCVDGAFGTVDRACTGVRQSERLQQIELRRL
jgi:hypothetical protein